MQLHQRLQSELNTQFELMDLFRYPTIATLAEFLSAAAPAATPSTTDSQAQRQQGKARLQQQRQRRQTSTPR